MDKETQDAINAAILKAIDPIAVTLKTLGDQQKIIVDTMAADAQKAKDAAAAEAAKPKETQAAPAKDAAAGKPLAAEDVAKLVSQGIAEALKVRDSSTQANAARDAFIADKLKGVPAPYAAKLGSDPAKWPAEEQVIRDGLKADLASLGFAPKDMGGGNPGGASGSGANPAEAAAGFKAAGLSDGQAAFAASLKLPV